MSTSSYSGRWTKHTATADFLSWCLDLKSHLGAKTPNFAIVFWSPEFSDKAGDYLEELQLSLKIANVVGCNASGTICNGEEFEKDPGMTVHLFCLPDTDVKTMHLESASYQSDKDIDALVENAPFSSESCNGFLIFSESGFQGMESVLDSWSQHYANIPIFGGFTHRHCQIYLNGRLKETGAVVIGFEGAVGLVGMTAQGCCPIGEPGPVTKSVANQVVEIGNRPAFKFLAETIKHLPSEEQNQIKGNLFLGLAYDEYKDSFRQGDFLIRNLLEADSVSGAISVSARIRPGQTIQFQRRDAKKASEVLSRELDLLNKKLLPENLLGGLIFSCVGRGAQLFLQDNHDAGMVSEKLACSSVTGFFSQGEIGPSGDRSYIHSFSACVVLFCFVDKHADSE